MNVYDQVSKARSVGTPLLGVTTPDQVATTKALLSRFVMDLDEAEVQEPLVAVQWDAVRGLQGLNANGKKWVVTNDPENMTIGLVPALGALEKLPEYAVTFFQNAQRYIESSDVAQAVFNLREEFKAHLQTLILMGPTLPLPAELRTDVMVFDEPLPDALELEKVVTVAYQSNKLKVPTGVTLEKAAGQLMGLSTFAAEQVAMMSMGDTGIEFSTLVERRYKTIDQNDGLKVYRGKEKFADIGGLRNIKAEFTRLIKGRKAPRLIVILEEMDKMFAGFSTDSTGIAQYQMGKTLSFMQDTEAVGAIGLGSPGTGKSLVAKALGNEAGIPAINIDFGAMQGGIVGVSQERTNAAFKVIEALSGGQAFFFGTCNKVTNLPPELRRRFRMGTYYFELPDAEEKDTIWKYYLSKYGFGGVELPNDKGWTGAEIWQCCDKAWRYGLNPIDVAGTVIPVSVAAFDEVEALRKSASGKYQSANHEGVYIYRPGTEEGVQEPVMGRKTMRKVQ